MINLSLKKLELIIFKLIFIRVILKYAKHPTTTHNYPLKPTTIDNYPKNHPQPSPTTQKLLKKKQRFVTNSDVPPQ